MRSGRWSAVIQSGLIALTIPLVMGMRCQPTPGGGPGVGGRGAGGTAGSRGAQGGGGAAGFSAGGQNDAGAPGKGGSDAGAPGGSAGVAGAGGRGAAGAGGGTDGGARGGGGAGIDGGAGAGGGAGTTEGNACGVFPATSVWAQVNAALGDRAIVSISALSPTDVWALGRGDDLALGAYHWNGVVWAQTGRLAGVRGPSGRSTIRTSGRPD